jgi:hypothetical protein
MQDTLQDHCRPIILPESDSRFVQWDDTREFFEGWMEEARMIAVAS